MNEPSPYLHDLTVRAAADFGEHTHASLILRHQGALVRPASSDARAARCDQVEARTGTGPCIQAMEQLYAVLLPSIRDDAADWPAWQQQALAERFTSVVAMPAHVAPGMDMALNLYSEDADPWDARFLLDADAHVQAIADALRTRIAQPDDEALVTLREALSTRTLIDQAVGVLMHANACSPSEALDVLLRMSLDSGVELARAARLVLRTLDVSTDLPAPPRPRGHDD
ncbi:ANTAR domain-containing protein [Cellulomonas sp. NPDC055163]